MARSLGEARNTGQVPRWVVVLNVSVVLEVRLAAGNGVLVGGELSFDAVFVTGGRL